MHSATSAVVWQDCQEHRFEKLEKDGGQAEGLAALAIQFILNGVSLFLQIHTFAR